MGNPLRSVFAAILLLLGVWAVVIASVSQMAGKLIRLQLAAHAEELRAVLVNERGQPANRTNLRNAANLDAFLIVLYWVSIVGLTAMAAWRHGPAIVALGAVIAVATTATAVFDAQQNRSLRALAAREPSLFTDADARGLRELSLKKWCGWSVLLVSFGALLLTAAACSAWMRSAAWIAMACGMAVPFGLPHGWSRWPITAAFAVLIAIGLPLAAAALLQGCG